MINFVEQIENTAQFNNMKWQLCI